MRELVRDALKGFLASVDFERFQLALSVWDNCTPATVSVIFGVCEYNNVIIF
jgi:hypothetical protein